MIVRAVGTEGRHTIEVSDGEVLLLANSLNEACNGIESWEFSTRLGGPRDAALALLEQLHGILASPSDP
jgi:hypothetical protein